ncbi:MAG: HdeD family acid-resistance protein [Nostoc sp. S4]|nr:HdeD family acid-resistance protein [Nostoc sp. S4]
MNNENINEMRRGSGWSMGLGIFMVVLGIGAIAEPLVATIAIAILLSWILLIAGIIRIIDAFQSRRKRGFWPKLLIGILYLLAGIVLISNIFGAALSLTLALGILFLIEGVFEVITAFQIRRDPNWGWTLFSGMMAIILGILILAEWPFSAAWVLGVFAGINFLLTGIWMIMLSLSNRRLTNHRTGI